MTTKTKKAFKNSRFIGLNGYIYALIEKNISQNANTVIFLFKISSKAIKIQHDFFPCHF